MSYSKKVNVFIAHTPLQNFIATKIVKQYYTSKEYKNVLYSSVYIKDNTDFQEYKFINKGSLWSKTINTYRVKKRIEKIIKRNKTNIHIAHTGALLDNYFFYSFPLHKYEAKINFFYEGVLYFYEYRQKTEGKEHLKRRLYGLLCNSKYNAKPVIFPSNDSRISKVFSILPEFTLGPQEKIVDVSISREEYKGKQNTILIMGGKPSLLNNEEVISIYKEMLLLIASYDQKVKVYFKGHHADTSNNFEIANRGLIQIEDITQNSPIEEVIALYNPSLVMSYPSSGLINLKAMYDNNIDMISYYTKEKKDQISYMEPIFDHMNIELRLI